MERDPVLDAVGPRLRALRQRHGGTLAELSAQTGISVSTLSRLESGGRKPTLELLLPHARRAPGHAHAAPRSAGARTPRTPEPVALRRARRIEHRAERRMIQAGRRAAELRTRAESP
jgi:transcriptional regulator with XRE-family HTH domain